MLVSLLRCFSSDCCLWDLVVGMGGGRETRNLCLGSLCFYYTNASYYVISIVSLAFLSFSLAFGGSASPLIYYFLFSF